MKKTKKNIISALLISSACTFGVIAPVGYMAAAPVTAEASTAGKTREQALAWARSQEGKGSDYDGYAGIQCTDLIQMYANALGQKLPAVGASKYITATLPKGWKCYDNKTVPQAGDIFIYESNKYGAYSAGHVGLILDVDADGYTCMEYNWSSRLYATTRYVNGQRSFSYIIRPDFPTSKISSAAKVSVDSGNYILNSAVGNKFLSVQGNSTADLANIYMLHPTGLGGQVFRISKNSNNTGYYINNMSSGKNIHTETDTPGRHNVIQHKKGNLDGQQWIFQDAGNGYVYIRNFFNYYLDVQSALNNDGTNVDVFEYNGTNAQKWKLVKVSGKNRTRIAAGDYVIQSKIGGKVLDVSGGSKKSGANIDIWSRNNSTAQTFTIGWDGNLGCSLIYNKASGKYVDTKAANGSEAANTTGTARQSDKTSNKTQSWFFEDAGDGYYYIRNLWGYYLDVANGTNADGTNVNVWKFTGGDKQKWKLIKKDTRTGVCYVDGKWVYLKYGEQDKNFTGVAKSTSGNYVFVRNGVFDHTFTGVARSTSGNYVFVKNGRYDAGYTGVARSVNGDYVFVKNGRYNTGFTGVARSIEGEYLYVKNGRHDSSAAGVVKSISGSYVYVDNGKYDSTYTGLARSLSSGALVYVKNGRFESSFNGEASFEGSTYDVKNGRVQ